MFLTRTIFSLDEGRAIYTIMAWLRGGIFGNEVLAIETMSAAIFPPVIIWIEIVNGVNKEPLGGFDSVGVG